MESDKKISIKEKLKLLYQGISKLPYKWAWLAMMICSAVLFSWWDDIIVWTIGVTLYWWLIPLYYFIEYCVMIPLVVLLADRTYEKLGLKISLKQVALNSLKNSLFAKIYLKLRKVIKK